jgi:hypothetical protein
MNDNEGRGRFLSDESINVIIDEPGDTTVRPIRPERVEYVKALRDEILAAEAAKKQAERDSRQA